MSNINDTLMCTRFSWYNDYVDDKMYMHIHLMNQVFKISNNDSNFDVCFITSEY